MAFSYAKLGMAALMAAAPAIAAPVPDVVYVTQTAPVVYQTQVVTVDQNGNVVVPAGPAAQPQPAQPQTTAQPTVAPVAAPSSSSSSSSSDDTVNAQAFSHGHASQHTSSAAAAQTTSAQAAHTTSAAAHTSSASSASAPTTSSGSSSGSTGASSGGKKGLVYNKDPSSGADAKSIIQAAGGSISWVYDWEGYTDVSGEVSTLGGAEFVPMLHSLDGTFTGPWASGNPGPQGKSASHALFINEPDNPASWADATTAAGQWSTFKQGAPKARLGGPAITNSVQPGQGKDWLNTFKANMAWDEVDFVCYHYYSPDGNLQNFQDAVKDIHTTYGKPIWVTEFSLNAVNMGGSASPEDRGEFIQKAAAWMDEPEQSYIERYAPYQVSSSSSQDSMQPNNAIAKAYIAA